MSSFPPRFVLMCLQQRDLLAKNPANTLKPQCLETAGVVREVSSLCCGDNVCPVGSAVALSVCLSVCLRVSQDKVRQGAMTRGECL